MFCSNCGNPLGEGNMFCSNCGQQINSSIQTNNKTDYSQLNNQIPTIKKDGWYYLGKGFGETREDVIRKTKRDLVIIAIVFSIFVGSAVVGAFLDGMSSSTASPSETVDTANPDTFLDNLGGYSEVIVESQWQYEYSQYSNEKIIVNCYFDVTNIGTATADNVQVDYSTLFDGRVLDTSTIYLGSIPAGSSLHREKSQSVTLNTFEWNDLIDEEEEIEVSLDEIRSE